MPTTTATPPAPDRKPEAKTWPLAPLLKRAGYRVPPSGGSRHITPREIRKGLDPTWPPKREEEE
jgi:hypothetical protein